MNTPTLLLGEKIWIVYIILYNGPATGVRTSQNTLQMILLSAQIPAEHVTSTCKPHHHPNLQMALFRPSTADGVGSHSCHHYDMLRSPTNHRKGSQVVAANKRHGIMSTLSYFPVVTKPSHSIEQHYSNALSTTSNSSTAVHSALEN
jgi:hypothetical protein